MTLAADWSLCSCGKWKSQAERHLAINAKSKKPICNRWCFCFPSAAFYLFPLLEAYHARGFILLLRIPKIYPQNDGFGTNLWNSLLMGGHAFMKNEHQAMAAYFKASKLMRGSVTDTFPWENVPRKWLALCNFLPTAWNFQNVLFLHISKCCTSVWNMTSVWNDVNNVRVANSFLHSSLCLSSGRFFRVARASNRGLSELLIRESRKMFHSGRKRWCANILATRGNRFSTIWNTFAGNWTVAGDQSRLISKFN